MNDLKGNQDEENSIMNDIEKFDELIIELERLTIASTKLTKMKFNNIQFEVAYSVIYLDLLKRLQEIYYFLFGKQSKFHEEVHQQFCQDETTLDYILLTPNVDYFSALKKFHSRSTKLFDIILVDIDPQLKGDLKLIEPDLLTLVSICRNLMRVLS